MKSSITVSLESIVGEYRNRLSNRNVHKTNADAYDTRLVYVIWQTERLCKVYGANCMMMLPPVGDGVKRSMGVRGDDADICLEMFIG